MDKRKEKFWATKVAIVEVDTEGQPKDTAVSLAGMDKRKEVWAAKVNIVEVDAKGQASPKIPLKVWQGCGDCGGGWWIWKDRSVQIKIPLKVWQGWTREKRSGLRRWRLWKWMQKDTGQPKDIAESLAGMDKRKEVWAAKVAIVEVDAEGQASPKIPLKVWQGWTKEGRCGLQGGNCGGGCGRTGQPR
jgi:hypothetical protein